MKRTLLAIIFCMGLSSGKINGMLCTDVFGYIREILPEGKTILELGSGKTTDLFSKFYTVFSIEHDERWINKYKSTYIFAPIKNGWYDVEIVKKQLPSKYDLILVDGPTGSIGRSGFFQNLQLFNTTVPIIIDDVNRRAERQLMMNVAKYLKIEPVIYRCKYSRQAFAVFLPTNQKSS